MRLIPGARRDPTPQDGLLCGRDIMDFLEIRAGLAPPREEASALGRASILGSGTEKEDLRWIRSDTAR